MLPGETILSGAPSTCPDCKVKPVFNVYKSGAGYYIGTYCDCGPYSRESEYYATREAAEEDLAGFNTYLSGVANLPNTARQ